MNGEELRRAVDKAVEANQTAMVHTLAELVQIPSVTGEEGKAQEYLAALYSRLGLEVTTFEPDIHKLRAHPAFSHPDSPDDRYRGRPNVLGTYRGQSGARSLKLNAHVDVVTPEPVAAWDGSPWSGMVVENRLYGRGATDDKGGLVANFFALKSLLDAGLAPEGTVILESAVEEEDGGAGTLASLLEGYLTDGLVVTDAGPTIVVSIAGLNYCKVRVKGRAMHAGWAEFGISAILKMNKICQALADLDERRGSRPYPLFLNRGKKLSCNLVISTYHAGDYRAAVPGWAEILCRVGSIPGETGAEVRRQVEEAIAAVARADDWLRENPPLVTWVGNPSEPWEQDPSHPFVQTFKECWEAVAGREALLTGMPASADARFSPYFGLPTLLTGPAGANGHAVDESVDLSSLISLTKALALFIASWCRAPRSPSA